MHRHFKKFTTPLPPNTHTQTHRGDEAGGGLGIPASQYLIIITQAGRQANLQISWGSSESSVPMVVIPSWRTKSTVNTHIKTSYNLFLFFKHHHYSDN